MFVSNRLSSPRLSVAERGLAGPVPRAIRLRDVRRWLGRRERRGSSGDVVPGHDLGEEDVRHPAVPGDGGMESVGPDVTGHTVQRGVQVDDTAETERGGHAADLGIERDDRRPRAGSTPLGHR